MSDPKYQISLELSKEIILELCKCVWFQLKWMWQPRDEWEDLLVLGEVILDM